MGLLRTLVIVTSLPYPPLAGEELRNWQNVYGLSSIGQVGVFGLCSNDPRSEKPPRDGLILWRSSSDVNLAYPQPKQVLAVARSWPLHPFGHPSDVLYSDIAASEIAQVMADFQPQLVIVESVWLYRYIDVLKKFNCRIVLDCHNVDGALFQEIADTISGDDLPARLHRKLVPSRTKLIEQKAIQAADEIWVCSDDDARLVKDLYGQSRHMHVIPNGIDVASYEVACRQHYERPERVSPGGRVVIFPAHFGSHPNAIAARFLVQEFFPLLTAIFPDCQLLLAGHRPTSEMIAAAKVEPRILVTAGVPDMRPYLAASSCVIVPLFQGGGTRFKILEAFAAGVPVVSTAKGAEGLAIEDGKHLLLAETANEFMNAVNRLWVEEDLGRRLAANGLQLVTESYSFPVINQKIGHAVHALLLSPDDRKMT